MRPGALGLRARASIAFALVGLVLSLVLALVTYSRSRSYLLSQRESVAVAQAAFNARVLSNALLADDSDPAKLVASVLNVSGSQPLLSREGHWFVTSANLTPDDLPAELRRRAFSGVPTRQRFELRGEPQFAVAIPLTRDATTPTVYIETSPLIEMKRTLQTLGATLVGGAVLATVVGALLGLYASGRVLRPVGAIADTAERIGAGDLDARFHDVHDGDLNRLATTFNAMTDTLEERIQRERRFASHVSHELRSPLTSLRGAMEIVNSRREQLPDRVLFGVDLLDQEISRFERMVLDLLEIARIEAGAATVDLVGRRVEPLVQGTLGRLGESALRVDAAADAADATVRIDIRRFERVLANLVDNANRHGTGATSVRIDRDGATVRIHVDDAGPGVPESERTQIFERFSRGANGRHLAGAGLGLALVREHLRLMDATVVVAESPDGGARFTVLLPEVATP